MPRADAFKPHDEHLDQGDILADVPFVKWRDGEPERGGGARGVITSNGCSCEDYERAVAAGFGRRAGKLMLQVAPLISLDRIPEIHRQEEIKAGEHLDRFYLYGDGTALPDQIVDLTREQPIPATVLSGCVKTARLADWQWSRLLVHIAVSRFHQSPEELFRDELLNTEEGTDAA